MAWGSIELNVTSTRVQDIAKIKSPEENRIAQEQNAIQSETNKKTQMQSKTVNETSKNEYNEFRYDAKDKGNGNGSSGQKKKNENKKDKNSDGVVIPKSGDRFNIKI